MMRAHRRILIIALLALVPAVLGTTEGAAQLRDRIDREKFRENFDLKLEKMDKILRNRAERRDPFNDDLQQSPNLCLINPLLPQCQRRFQ